MELNKILVDREERANLVKTYIDKYQVVTLKANIPGPNKNIPISYILINLFKDKLAGKLNPLSMSFYESSDGPYYIFLFNKDKVLKNSLKELEEEKLGRFVDIDCFYDSSKSISRNNPRRCYLCDDLAFNCIRSKKHSLEDLIDYVNNEVKDYLKEFIHSSIVESALEELNLDTKFGLVTPSTSGSHKNMDYNLMKESINVISPYLTRMFNVGFTSNNSLDEIFNEVRLIGLDAEEAMFNQTKGINTYQGLIFNLGLVVTNLGYCLNHKQCYETIFENCSYMVRNLNTSKGALQEAYSKYSNVNRIVELYSLEDDDSKRYALIDLIINVNDSIFNKRCNDEAKRDNLRKDFKVILNTKDRGLINRLNETCINQGYSFGGCADLLVVSIFLKKMRKLFK